jgi:hypothetical protein
MNKQSNYTFWDEMWNVPPKPIEKEETPEKEKED